MNLKTWLVKFVSVFPDDVKARYSKHYQEKEGVFGIEKYNLEENREMA